MRVWSTQLEEMRGTKKLAGHKVTSLYSFADPLCRLLHGFSYLSAVPNVAGRMLATYLTRLLLLQNC